MAIIVYGHSLLNLVHQQLIVYYMYALKLSILNVQVDYDTTVYKEYCFCWKYKHAAVSHKHYSVKPLNSHQALARRGQRLISGSQN